ncbi:MAG: transposase [Pirellulaceae bacterium]|nr:MAG: transposase [Pirellulaceae bacterium]
MIRQLSHVYRVDAEARRKGLSPQKRLALHRAKSQRVMDGLHKWLTRQLDDRLVEPNSALGQAINYMLKHWERLTQFLRVPGAPLDNNVAERALKKSILHRKNSLYYRSPNGAEAGDVYMTLIHTCELNRINPYQYLVALLRHADDVASQPHAWLPWNYARRPNRACPGGA